jgi:glutamine amidotransferase
MKSICILDYGLGNVSSLNNAIRKVGYFPDFYSEKKNKNYEIILIPGVGSFSRASKLINRKYLIHFIKNNYKNNCLIFGICIGMQLLCSEGNENGINKGINLIKGNVDLIKGKKIKLPVIGWQKVQFINDYLGLKKKYNNEKFYFLHSYAPKNISHSNQLSITKYMNIKYISSIFDKNIIGTQFHPEKSGEVGLEFLKDIIKNR